MNILFISIEGNTRSFLTRLQAYAQQQHSFNPQLPTINLKEITDQTLPAAESEPFFAFVPTYLDGGNGFDSGVKELMFKRRQSSGLHGRDPRWIQGASRRLRR